MEALPILIFILFAVASVIEKVLKQQQPPKDGPKPGPRPPVRPRPQATRVPPARTTQPPRSGRADEMIPEDFWRELTGQARRPAPTPAPVPPQPDLPTWDEEGVAAVEAAEDEEPLVAEARSLEDFRRERISIEEEPVIVSLEALPPPPERRHALFHERMAAQTRVPAKATSSRPAPASSLRARLRQPAGARDALVLSEVLGRPKGLEP